MKIRALEQSDIPRIQELFAQQSFEYVQPDWSKLQGQALVNDQGVICMVLADRLTVEMYMLADKGEWAAPGMKFELFQQLHEAERRNLRQRGIDDVHAWIPKCARSFARRLQKVMGWVHSSGPDGWLGLTRNT